MDTPTWQRTNTEGLYLNTHSGVYYSRYRLKGKRTFRSLKTTVLTRAKILHATKRVDLEKDRARDVGLTGRDSTDYRTLGALVKEAERRFAATKVACKTVEARAAGIARLRKHWIDGTFETFPARNVTPDTIVRLRQHLLTEAEWRGHRHINFHLGFHPRVVNHALWVLRVLLDIAIEKGLLVEQPFIQTGTLRKTLRAIVPADKKAEIPDRSVMVRVFAEMRRVPEEAKDFYTTREQLRQLQINAEEMADHAELLAYSGMRRDEAKKSTLADDKNGEFKIWGTKSVTSDRTIPVNPALRGTGSYSVPESRGQSNPRNLQTATYGYATGVQKTRVTSSPQPCTPTFFRQRVYRQRSRNPDGIALARSCRRWRTCNANLRPFAQGLEPSSRGKSRFL